MRVQPLSLVGVIVSIAAITPIPPIHAEQPVHELQVTAGKFAFEPATIQVVAGEPSGSSFVLRMPSTGSRSAS